MPILGIFATAGEVRRAERSAQAAQTVANDAQVRINDEIMRAVKGEIVAQIPADIPCYSQLSAEGGARSDSLMLCTSNDQYNATPLTDRPTKCIKVDAPVATYMCATKDVSDETLIRDFADFTYSHCPVILKGSVLQNEVDLTVGSHCDTVLKSTDQDFSTGILKLCCKRLSPNSIQLSDLA